MFHDNTIIIWDKRVTHSMAIVTSCIRVNAMEVDGTQQGHFMCRSISEKLQVCIHDTCIKSHFS